MPEIRAGVIGAGHFFETIHLPCMRRVPGLRIVAVCDRSEHRLAKARGLAGEGAQLYADHRRMLDAGGLDAVYMLVNPEAVSSIVPDVTAARLPLFCEKPPATTSSETRMLAEITSQARLPHQIGFNRRFGPFTARFREWLRTAGTPSRVEVVFHRVWAPSPEKIVGSGIHAIDLMLSLLGPVRCVAARRAAPRGAGFGAFTAALEFVSGAIGTFVYDNRMSAPAEEYHVQVVSQDTLTVERLCLRFPVPSKLRGSCSASRTKMVYRDWVDSRAVWDEQKEEYERPDLREEDDLLVGGGYMDEHETFVRNLRAGVRLGPTFAETVHSMEVAEAIHEGQSREFQGERMTR